MVLTVAEAAALLRVSENTIRNAIRAGELPALRLGTGKRSGTYRILREDFDSFVEKSRDRVIVCRPALPRLAVRPAVFRHIDPTRWLAAQGLGGPATGKTGNEPSKPFSTT